MENIVRRHGLSYHKYADDMQLYGEFDPTSDSDRQRIQRQLEDCLAEIRAWMLANMLKINDDKTELVVFMNPQQRRTCTVHRADQADPATITLGDSTITAADTVRNLGVMMDSCLDGSAHVSSILKSCNFHLSQIARIRRYITDNACKLAVLGLVISRMDYCNGLLGAAMELQLDKLQKIQNRAARLVARPRVPRGHILHITPILHQLHWLPVRQRVTYKLCLHVWTCLQRTAPSYMQELLTLYVRDQRLRRASHLELVPRRPRRRVGKAGFCVAGPAAWNTLPEALRSIDSVCQFKKHLKTYLWTVAYG